MSCTGRRAELERFLRRARDEGLLGPGPVGLHIDHAMGFAAAAPTAPATALDLGSGAGVPGLVLAVLCWPETHWTLLDAGERRCVHLREAVQALGLAHRVTVRRQRAEEAGRDAALREGLQLIVARSFASPGVTAECAAPFLADRAHLVVSEPPTSQPQRWPVGPLTELGLTDCGTVGAAGAHYRVLQRTGRCSDRYPRRTGVPAKRPLF